MSNFFAEFKKFITRGNIVDMSVGVIVGGAFTAIVNGLSNYVLKPIINFVLALVFGTDSLSELYTFLKRVDVAQDVLDAEGNVIGTKLVPDLTQSIYIDWGSFINAIINFFIIALVLFSIVRIINGLREEHAEYQKKINEGKPSKEDKAAMKKLGINLKDEAAVKAYYADKKKKEEEAKKEAEEKARKEREENPTTEDLLKKIIALLEEK